MVIINNKLGVNVAAIIDGIAYVTDEFSNEDYHVNHMQIKVSEDELKLKIKEFENSSQLKSA